MIGTDLAHTRMVVFPQDVKFYVDDSGNPLKPEEFPIADAVRISAGFPYFFPPMKLRDGVTKKDGVLVDGGVVSAYPIFLFDSEDPKHPTWGFRLYSGKPPESPRYQEIDGFFWWVDMLKAIVDTSMNAFDNFEMVASRRGRSRYPPATSPPSTSPSPRSRRKSCTTSATRRRRNSSKPLPTGATPSAPCRRVADGGPQVRPATVDDHEAAAEALALAFADDPAWAHLMPNDATRAERLLTYFTADIENLVPEYRQLWVTDDGGGAGRLGTSRELAGADAANPPPGTQDGHCLRPPPAPGDLDPAPA